MNLMQCLEVFILTNMQFSENRSFLVEGESLILGMCLCVKFAEYASITIQHIYGIFLEIVFYEQFFFYELQIQINVFLTQIYSSSKEKPGSLYRRVKVN